MMERVLTDSKYQTLANEYSKVTAKCSILKKAVLDEQAKSSSLKCELHESDRQLRLQRQESEALSFRNQQLLRRVELLQSELDEQKTAPSTRVQSRARKKLERLRTSSASPSPATPSPSPDIIVLQEELQQKIDDNVRLNRRLEETRSEHLEEIGTLTSRLNYVESRLATTSVGVSITTAAAGVSNTTTTERSPSIDSTSTYHDTDTNTAVVSMVLRDNVSADGGNVSPAPSAISAVAVSSAADLKLLSDRLKLREQQVDALKRQLFTARAKLQYFVLLDDSDCPSLCSLNVPLMSRGACYRAAMHCSRISSALNQLLMALADWLTATEQRLILLTQRQQLGVSNVSKSFRLLLEQRSVILSAVEQAMTSVTSGVSDSRRPLSLSTLPELYQLHRALVSLHVFLQRFVGHLRLSIQEDDTFSRSSAHLYTGSVTSVTSVVGRLTGLLKTLCVFTKNPRDKSGCIDPTKCQLPSNSAVSRLLQTMSVVLDDFMRTLRASCDVYSAHVDSDIDNDNLDLIRLERHLVANLQTAATCAEALSEQWLQSVDWLSSCVGARVRGYHVQPRSRAAGGQREEAQKDEEEVEDREWCRTPTLSPSVTALVHRNMAYMKSTAQPLSLPGERSGTVVSLSTGSNHPHGQQQEEPGTEDPNQITAAAHLKQLEKQLLGREQQLQQLQLENNILQLKIQEEQGETAAEGVKSKRFLSGDDGRLCAHVQHQIEQLVEREQFVASSCRHYQLECRNISRQLTVSEDSCRKLRESLEQLKSLQQQTVDELTATRNTYDNQLATMSEHLATLNRTMTQQRDEIDHLRYQKSQLLRSSNSR